MNLNGNPNQLASTAPKESQISQQFDSQTRALDNLEGLLNQLADRLQPVCRSEPSGMNKPETPDTLVGLAERIRSHTDRIGTIANGVNYLLRVLEL